MSDSAIGTLFLFASLLIAIAASIILLAFGRARTGQLGRIQKVARPFAITTLVSCTIVGALLTYRMSTGNIHEVIAGEFYRAGQLTPAQLTETQRRFGLRSVINLRGANPESAWYRDELSTSQKLGLTHLDFRVSAKHALSRAAVDQLIALMRSAPKPLLVHCESGADRTGLASALYLFAIARAPEETAERQLSPVFGHIGVPVMVPGFAMDETWERYEHWIMATAN